MRFVPAHPPSGRRPLPPLLLAALLLLLAPAPARGAGLIASNYAPLTEVRAHPNNGFFTHLAMSGDGSVLCVVAAGGFVEVSTDGGQTWATSSDPSTGAGMQYWYSCAVSRDGTKLFAVAAVGSTFQTAQPMRRSEDSGATWSPVGPAMDFVRVACADDGQTLVAIVTENSRREIYVSADSGATWTRRWAPAPAGNWQKVAISGDGRKLIVVGQNGAGVVISRDVGVSWAVPASYPNAGTEHTHGAIDAAFSTDGAKLVVVTYAYIYTSADAGETWSAARAHSTRWKTVASSGDGVKLDALAEDGGLWTSLDSGVTWRKTATFAQTNSNPTIATSRDGVRLAALQASGSVWTSTYAQAAAFLPVAEQGECDYIAAAGSSDGARLAFFCTLGTTTTTLLTSDNSGDSWTRRDHGMALSGWIDDLASSSDGSRLFAAEYATDGGLWTSDDLRRHLDEARQRRGAENGLQKGRDVPRRSASRRHDRFSAHQSLRVAELRRDLGREVFSQLRWEPVSRFLADVARDERGRRDAARRLLEGAGEHSLYPRRLARQRRHLERFRA